MRIKWPLATFFLSLNQVLFLKQSHLSILASVPFETCSQTEDVHFQIQSRLRHARTRSSKHSYNWKYVLLLHQSCRCKYIILINIHWFSLDAAARQRSVRRSVGVRKPYASYGLLVVLSLLTFVIVFIILIFLGAGLKSYDLNTSNLSKKFCLKFAYPRMI